MQITRMNILKAGLATFGAIIIGAVGSGVWEGLLGPALRALRNWILDSVSLVFFGFKNGIYAEIARDHPSAVSMASHALLLMLFFLMFVAVTVHFAESIRGAKRKLEDLARRIEEFRLGKPKGQMTAVQVDTEIRQMLREIKGTWKVLYTMGGVMVLFLAMNIFNYSRLSYIDSALVHYHQVLRIASPYLKPDEKLAVESQFALIHTKHDYAQVVERLAGIAKAHGQSVPNFDPW